jgi:hypothetical protein
MMMVVSSYMAISLSLAGKDIPGSEERFEKVGESEKIDAGYTRGYLIIGSLGGLVPELGGCVPRIPPRLLCSQKGVA